MKYRGHTLVWTEEALPKWFAGYATKSNAESLLAAHITRKWWSHYAGKMQSWDVIDEALLPGRSPKRWAAEFAVIQLLGPDYIEMALRAAAQADLCSALLVWNKTWIEERDFAGGVQASIVFAASLGTGKTKERSHPWNRYPVAPDGRSQQHRWSEFPAIPA